MADRRSLFSRFWPASASRRTRASQTTAPPPAITDSPTSKSKPLSRTTPTSVAPPTAETRSLAKQSTTVASSPPSLTPQPTTDHQTAEEPSTSSEPRKSPSSQADMANQPTATTSANTIDEPKTKSSSRETSSPSKPASPNRRVAQSRSPPQPSSPAPHTQRKGTQIPSTPKWASQPRSPSRLNSPSPKQGSHRKIQPTSPSKESRQSSEEVWSNENVPKPAASQQEPQLKADSANDFNGKTLDGTSFKHDEVGLTPSEIGTRTTSAQSPKAFAPSKSLDTSTINAEHKPLIQSNAKPEETKDVKEVAEATNAEANEEMKKEALIVEKVEIPREKQEALHTKEALATSLTGATPGETTTSQSKKRNTISGTHHKSALPNGEHVPLHKNIRDRMSTFTNQIAIGDPKGAIYDKPVSVITIAGENRGASMHMESNSSKGEGSVHIHRSYKINPDESAEATTDGEGSSGRKKSADANSTDDQPTEAYVNNNAQGINNSIVFNSSFSEGNPGVHMIVTHLPKEPIQDKEHPQETRKAEFKMTRMEKLTYQPTVRRRCLRGLFLETSDSDPENPEKPRHHGCRVGCEKRDKENNIDML